jgi:hypothetical protein
LVRVNFIPPGQNFFALYKKKIKRKIIPIIGLKIGFVIKVDPLNENLRPKK